MPLKKFVPTGTSKVVRKATEEEASTLAVPSASGAVAMSFKGPEAVAKPATAAVAKPATAVAAKPAAVAKPATAVAAKPATAVAAKPATAVVAKPATAVATVAKPAAVAVATVPTRRRDRLQDLLDLPAEADPHVADYNDYEDTFREKVDETPLLKNYIEGQAKNEETNTYTLDTKIYMPSTRSGFYKFIQTTYADKFSLPTVVKNKELDPAACEKLMSGGPSRVEPFLYQRFIKEYMRMRSPYRGMVVYHGLGSGKTCSAILAAEALYGQSAKRMIVMTPKSLRANFMNDIIFACGFRHFSPTNYWTALPLTKVLADGTTVFLIAAEMYARSVLSLSREFLDQLKERKKRTPCVLWIPDFSKPPSESNFKTLEPFQQDEIQAQINEMITNRVEFISYNGITSKKLKQIACTNPTYFDNAVIVIDEIHNMIRLMNSSIVPYLTTRAGKGKYRKVKAEQVEVGRWEPLLCSEPDKNYKRGYLMYRLLCGARNSKIIGLSGTPLINYPQELGILSNVLAGYIDCAEITLASPDPAKAAAFRLLAEKDPRVDFIRMNKGDTYHKVILSIFQEGYVKVLKGAAAATAAAAQEQFFVGVQQSDDPGAQVGIREVVARLRLAAEPGLIASEPTFSAKERLPVEGQVFQEQFISVGADGNVLVNSQNTFVLQKRLSGLVSYYRGAGESFYPAVIKDEVINCDMSPYASGTYLDIREVEIEAEKKKKAKKTGDKLEAVFAMVELFGTTPPPDSYQFRSRAVCNFAFPGAIERPYPKRKGEEKEELGGDEDAYVDDDAEDGGASVRTEIEAEEAAADQDLGSDGEGEGEEEAAVVTAVVAAASTKPLTYSDRIRQAMNQLYKDRALYMNLESDTETKRLSHYSRKLHEILVRMKAATGPVMVYSQFKTVEGLGVLGVALQANGYDEIAIERWDGNTPVFTAKTIASIQKGPSEKGGVPKRFITFSGDSGSRPTQRAVLINLFNGQWAKLPRGVKALFEGAGFDMNKKYTHGEICACIGITSAGAEGISLRNVRQVHIMEPYWNMVRIEQVKGRAVRICSHMDLPKEERNVEIYTYVATFSKEDTLTIPKAIVLADSYLDKVVTTDYNILLVSKRKALINEKLLHVMKESAVDCKLNQPDNELLTCFTTEGKNPYMFDPDLKQDVITTVSEYGIKKKGPTAAAAATAATAATTAATATAATTVAVPKTITVTKISIVEMVEGKPIEKEYLVGPEDPDTRQVKLYADTDKELKTPLYRGTAVPNPAGGVTYTDIGPIPSRAA